MSGGRPWAGIVLRALGFGVVMMIVLPVVASLSVLALAHLADDCGPGSSGGCEMGAAGIGLIAIIPGFVLGAGWSVFSRPEEALMHAAPKWIGFRGSAFRNAVLPDLIRHPVSPSHWAERVF